MWKNATQCCLLDKVWPLNSRDHSSCAHLHKKWKVQTNWNSQIDERNALSAPPHTEEVLACDSCQGRESHSLSMDTDRSPWAHTRACTGRTNWVIKSSHEIRGGIWIYFLWSMYKIFMNKEKIFRKTQRSKKYKILKSQNLNLSLKSRLNSK